MTSRFANRYSTPLTLPTWVDDLKEEDFNKNALPLDYNPRPLSYKIPILALRTAAVAAALGALVALPVLFSFGGWALAATAGLTVLVGACKVYLVASIGRIIHKNINYKPYLGESKEDVFRDYTNSLVRRNGLKDAELNSVVVRQQFALPETFDYKINKGLRKSAAILSNPAEMQNKMTVIVGEEAAQKFDKEQFDAVIIHEAGHGHNRRSLAYRATHGVASAAVFGAIGVALFTFNFAAAAMLVGTHIFSKYLWTLANRVDERRADRNAVLAQKSTKGLEGALGVIAELMSDGDERKRQKTMKQKFVLFKPHPPISTRLRHMKYVAKRHGLTV